MSIDQFSDAVVQWAQSFSEINHVWLYGSRVKGNARPDSDLDIAVELDPYVLRGVDPYTYWLLESQNMKEAIKLCINVAPHVQLYDPTESYDPTENSVFSAVKDHGILVYVKNSPRRAH